MDISVVSLKDGRLLVGRGAKRYLDKPDLEMPSWYTPDFFLRDELPWHVHESYEVVEKFDFPQREMYLGEMESFRERYETMKLEKGVVYTRCQVLGFDPFSALSRLNSGHIYATDKIIGATPEILFDLNSTGLTTMALASTAEKVSDLEGEKEQEEHEIVVRSIFEALSPFGLLEKGERSALPYGNLFHLQTPIQLTGQISFEEAVQALHPTAAVGAWPKTAGKKWLLEQEQHLPRKRYGAPFGYIFPERNEARAFVAIRCVQWDDQGAYLWAGAGITSKSSYEKERAEIQKKLEATASMMGENSFSKFPPIL